MRFHALVWAAGLSLAATAPALAAPADFQACDGYGAPNGSGDGMTRPAGRLLGLIPPSSQGGTGRQNLAVRDQRGVNACHAALADERLRPAYTLRRASLLRARGIHRLSAGETGDALVDFDLAERAVTTPADPYYRRSFALGTRMLRAFAGSRSEVAEQAAHAAEEAGAVAAARPYDPELALVAARVQLAANHDWDAYVARLREQARYDPSRINALFIVALLRGRFEEAVALHPMIYFDVPVGRGGFVVQRAVEREEENEDARAQMDGAFAYALAATGQAERGRALLAERLTAGAQKAGAPPAPEPVPAADDDSDPRRAALVRWQGLVDMRGRVAEGHAEEVLTALLRTRPHPDSILLDLLQAIHRALPNDPRLTDETIAALRAIVDRQREQVGGIDLQRLVEALPEAEVVSRLPGFQQGSDSQLLLRLAGYMSRPGPVEGSLTVKFATRTGTFAAASELALLRAAQLARERNLRGFIVLGRRGLIRSEARGIFGDQPAGFEAEFDVLFVDPAALPTAYRDAGWRVVDADAVWSALSPVYVARTGGP